MSRIRLSVENGYTPHVVDLPTAVRERILAPLRDDVDLLAELRDLIGRATEAERAMTAEILQAMAAAGVRRLEGARAVAVRESVTKTNPVLRVEPLAADTEGV